VRKLACIVKGHNGAGFFSLFNKVVQCLTLYRHVHVDWSEGSLYGNCWDELFYPTTPPTGEHDVVTFYPDNRITGIRAHQLYGLDEWRFRYNFFSRQISIKQPLYDRVHDYCESYLYNRDPIGVLVRATTHAGEQPSLQSQSLEDYEKAIQKLWQPNSTLHVMSQDSASIKWLHERFPGSSYPLSNRSLSRDTDRHLAGAQTAEDAKNVFVEMLILARCRALVHPVSNIATAALYYNPILEGVYLP
jgi:hypothetical protein